jgi:hypothetical protein
VAQVARDESRDRSLSYLGAFVLPSFTVVTIVAPNDSNPRWCNGRRMSMGMRTAMRIGKILAVGFVLAGAASMAVAQEKAANVAGEWTIDVTRASGSAKQSITLTQGGGKISGTFKGPKQSGTIDGTVDGNSVKFHVTAQVPLDYSGTVDGDTMSGTMSGNGKSAAWKATRAK